jgi:hypothetical protein
MFKREPAGNAKTFETASKRRNDDIRLKFFMVTTSTENKKDS